MAVPHGKFTEHRRFLDLAHINESKNGRQALRMGLVGKIRFAAVPYFYIFFLEVDRTENIYLGFIYAVCIVNHGLTCIPVNLVLARLKTRPIGTAPSPLNPIGVPLGPGSTWFSSHGPKR